MNKITVTIRDAIYIVTLIVTLAANWVRTDSKIDQLKKDVESNTKEVSGHTENFKTYNPAVFQVQLENIQKDIQEIKTLIKEDKKHD